MMITALESKKYVKHTVHNEKLNKWLIENHIGCTHSTDYMGITKGSSSLVCDCHMKDEGYVFFYDKYPTSEEAGAHEDEILVHLIPELTEEEKEDLRDYENIRIYLCPVCGAWGVDSDQ